MRRISFRAVSTHSMEKIRNDTQFLTLVLAIISGYSDALTYVAAGGIFSNHVTGNIILFAYHLITGTVSGTWSNLLTIPIFICSVMMGGWILENYSNKHLFFFEGLIFLNGGMLACIFDFSGFEQMTMLKYLVAMQAVLAMGIQSAFGKRFAEDTYGLTTIMTGNLIELSLQTESYLGSGLKKARLLVLIIRRSITIGGFLTGCIFGAYAGQYFGLAGMILPGAAILLVFSLKKSFKGLSKPIV